MAEQGHWNRARSMTMWHKAHKSMHMLPNCRYGTIYLQSQFGLFFFEVGGEKIWILTIVKTYQQYEYSGLPKVDFHSFTICSLGIYYYKPVEKVAKRRLSIAPCSTFAFITMTHCSYAIKDYFITYFTWNQGQSHNKWTEWAPKYERGRPTALDRCSTAITAKL